MTKAELINKYGIDWYEAHKVKVKTYYKERYTTDVNFREIRKSKNREYIKERYNNDNEYREAQKIKCNARGNECYNNDAKFREGHKAKMRVQQRERYNNDVEYAMNKRLSKTIHRYCRIGEEVKIENYELAKADNFKGWDIHHRLELTLDGDFAHSKEDLIRLGMYYNRPYFELIFLRHNEHSKLHKGSYEV